MFLIPNSDSFGEMGLLDEPAQTSEVRECDANGECADCKKKRLRKMKEMGPGKVHSAKFDRCTDKVGAKGKVSNKYAVCMASLGKGKALRQGHGGRAVEVNHCHGPGKGHPCDGGGGLDPVSQKSADRAMGATLARKQIMSGGLADSIMKKPSGAFRPPSAGEMKTLGTPAGGTADPKDLKLGFKLSTALIKYDKRREGKAGYNRYALPQYLGAMHRAEAEIAKGTSVRKALVNNFTGSLLDTLLKAVGEPKGQRHEHR